MASSIDEWLSSMPALQIPPVDMSALFGSLENDQPSQNFPLPLPLPLPSQQEAFQAYQDQQQEQQDEEDEDDDTISDDESECSDICLCSDVCNCWMKDLPAEVYNLFMDRESFYNALPESMSDSQYNEILTRSKRLIVLAMYTQPGSVIAQDTWQPLFHELHARTNFLLETAELHNRLNIFRTSYEHFIEWMSTLSESEIGNLDTLLTDD